MSKVALLIVDLQNDFLPGGSLAVPQGDEIIKPINRLQRDYDLVVATQDWHPANHGSFASRHRGKKPYDMGTLSGKPQMLWPDHCVQGTAGAALSDELDQKHIACVIRKGMDAKIDSYSAFFDNGHLRATGLEGYLRGLDVSEVHLCGLAADYCVYYSAMDALTLGFKASILRKATRAIDINNFEKLMIEFLNHGGKAI